MLAAAWWAAPMTDDLAPDPVRYLDHVAGTDPARRYEREMVEALDLRPGLTVLDVGCGPGTDLVAFADAVGPDGKVVGVDSDPRMVAEATARLATRACVEVRPGDAHELPLDADSVDRAHLERVVQHLEDPGRALAELRRVVRPGGLVGLAEPDWDTLVIDCGDVAVGRAFARFLADVQVRNGTVGRRLVRLVTERGLAPRTVTGTTIVLRDLTVADAILGLRRNAHRAITVGFMAEEAARAWLDRLGHGPFFAAFVLFSVTAEVPA
jgi:ubiquinone/menaquinone biosynthesis C-methylase UbiE